NQRDSLMNAAAQKMIDEAVGGNKFLSATVSALYGGNYFYLIVYKIYRDVRFVGAPPSSIGKFGADTDNWMWPRHTCDFSMFRIYSDANGNPAEYSPDNVPYNPATHLTISLKGINEGDFSMIIGYPGSTNRYLTGPEISMVRAGNEAGIYCRGHRQEVLMADMLADPAVRLKYASKYSSSSNYWKNWIGMNEQIANLKVEERRYENDNAFRNWIAAKPGRNKKYAGVLDEIYSLVDKMTQYDVNLTYLTESLGRVEIGSVANNVSTRLRNYDSFNEATRADLMDAVLTYMEGFYKDYNMPTDVKVTKEMIRVAKDKLPADLLPEFFEVIDSEFAGDIDAYVDDLFATSAFSSLEKAKTDIAAKAANGRISFVDDPAYMFVQDYRTVGIAVSLAYNELAEKLEAAHKKYIAGQLEMNAGKAVYPDANSTMRLTYGTVKAYEPKDGVIYKYYTTLKGVMEKEDPDNWEFVVPAKLKELYAAKDFGRYANPDGSMPNCFIMTGDITGGNSGSPVFNGRGELTGLAFDGNWEAMSGDIIFEPDLQRCICVDIRYVLFIIDKFGGAGYLLNEMTLN
ncbi:MAG: S46 family peptidase, partial [Bacteroidales bacterium]|nr:S46 family peptidase [Bacteroidales bacterium]